jgi:Na+-transporting methylmalonyl-CoA/oxaloacetate decarboxylase beta subunit
MLFLRACLFAMGIFVALTIISLLGLGGLAGVMIAYNKLSKGKINPVVDLAGVSCVPSAAKVAQKLAFKANKRAMILPFAMGSNVAGVITTAIVAGLFISAITQYPAVINWITSG